MKYESIMNNSVSCFGEFSHCGNNFLGKNWRFSKNSNAISTKFSVLLTSITTFSSSQNWRKRDPWDSWSPSKNWGRLYNLTINRPILTTKAIHTSHRIHWEDVKCCKGQLKLKSIQIEGKKKKNCMSFRASKLTQL